MKKIIGLLIGLLLIGLVQAIDVRCDEGRFNSDVCRDFELQDEFDTVEDMINDVEYRSMLMDETINLGSWNRDLYIYDYMKENEQGWTKDSVGNGGMGIGSLTNYLYGYTTDRKLMFSNRKELTHKGFYSRIEKDFVTKTEFEEMVDHFNAILKYGHNDKYTVALAKSERIGEVVSVGNSKCSNVIGCLTITGTSTSKKTIDKQIPTAFQGR